MGGSQRSDNNNTAAGARGMVAADAPAGEFAGKRGSDTKLPVLDVVPLEQQNRCPVILVKIVIPKVGPPVSKAVKTPSQKAITTKGIEGLGH